MEKGISEDKRNSSYQIKYDINEKPYFEVVFLNKSKEKTITTFYFRYDYQINANHYTHRELIHQTIQPLSRKKFIIKINDALLTNYTEPSDFSVSWLDLYNFRYIDGSVKNDYVVLITK
jgi:hypothetical protein